MKKILVMTICFLLFAYSGLAAPLNCNQALNAALDIANGRLRLTMEDYDSTTNTKNLSTDALCAGLYDDTAKALTVSFYNFSFDDDVTMVGDFGLTGDFTQIGDMDVTGAFDVTGNSTMDGSLSVNASQADLDTVFAGDTDADLLYIDAGNNRVGIRTSAPTANFTVDGSMLILQTSTFSGSIVKQFTTTEYESIAAATGGGLVNAGQIQTYVTHGIGTATAAATFDVEVDIPAGALLKATQCRVDTLLASGDGGTTWSIAYIDGSTASIGTGLAFAKDTVVSTFFDANAATAITSAETDLQVTINSGNFTAGGQVRCISYYDVLVDMGAAP